MAMPPAFHQSRDVMGEMEGRRHGHDGSGLACADRFTCWYRRAKVTPMLASLSGRRLLQSVALVAVVAIVPARSIHGARVAHPVSVAPNEVRVPYFGASRDGKCPARTRE